MINSFEYDFSELGVDEQSIYLVLQAGKGNSVYDFSDLTEELLGSVSRISKARAEYRIYPVGEWNDDAKTVTLAGVVFSLNDIVFKQLRLAESVAIFLCTAGSEVEKLGRKAMEDGDPLASYICDIIGSEMAERASYMALQEVRKAAETSGMKVTNRYSPGYCGWDVSDQHALFELMPDNTCGISLNESALMSPEKSVSGIIGIGRNVSFDPYPCSLCQRTECLYRRIHK